MRRFLFFGAGLLLLVGSLWYADTRLVAPPVAPTPTSLPTRAAENTPPTAVPSGPQVVVVSLAGAQAGRIDTYLADGTMPNLARLKSQGAMAQYALSVDPAQAAPAHMSLATGAYPAVTGVVGDRYHLPGDDLDSAVDALDAASLGAEPVWRTAMREAHRTAALFWPGISLDVPAGLADYSITRGAVDAASARHEVTFTTAAGWLNAPSSLTLPREGMLAIRKDGVALAQVYVLAIDARREEPGFDTFILDRQRRVGPTSAWLRLGDTAPLVIDDHVASGAYFSLTRAGDDGITLYQSPVCYNQAQPSELVREVNRRFGFYPPDPDGEALRQSWITPEQYLRMAEVQSRWVVSVTAFVLETYRPELLFAGYGTLDALQRDLLLADAAQPGYTPERAAEYDRYLRRGYALADAAAGALATLLDLEQATLVVVSDRGAAPVHTQVNLNALLAARRLLVYEEGPGRRVSVAQSKAVAVASGAVGHIYVNLRQRERAGIVPDAEYRKVQDAILATLQPVQDTNGRPVFARLVRFEELGDLNLGAETAGDVVAQAAPGFVLSASRSPAVLEPAQDYGAAGYDARLPEMQAIFLAVGRGIRVQPDVGPVHILDLAPTVGYLLGLQPQAAPAGRVLEEMVLPAAP